MMNYTMLYHTFPNSLMKLNILNAQISIQVNEIGFKHVYARDQWYHQAKNGNNEYRQKPIE